MKLLSMSAVFLTLAATTLSAAPASLEGTYLEARTAEVFAGGCVINSEAGTTGREAVLAWKVDRGQFNGVALDGLSVMAAVAGDTNLGVHEIGGERAQTRTAIVVDARATAAQRTALIAMVQALSTRTVSDVVEVTSAPIEFVAGEKDVRIASGAFRLAVHKELDHTMSCGNKQWFSPLATVHHAQAGTTLENAFSGNSLGTKWSDPNKRSAFYGTFSY
ncbi:hypothetical protein LuPra_05245 [Luteitalea pratensis]|uniref:DUF1326 domain-containing protein n=1 Tax=Luteitalea pratensis TaxID=1855912 RepID=A0A143PTJ9_LUTPR|nr:DUF1326 domain-containing protein [Luteitalea pratensis]AMY11975.1 hypothetical protein LuPra_05245 [Luteitalea pratensis]